MALNARHTKGIEIEIGGNTTGLKTALDGANSSIKKTQTELDTLKNSLKLDWNPDSFKRAQELAQRALEETQKKADSLRKAMASMGDMSSASEAKTEQYEALRRELSYVEVEAQKAAGQIEKLNRIPLDNLKSSLSSAGESLDKMGNKLTMGLTVPLVAAGTAAVNYSSDTVESIGKVEVAFGYAAEGVKKWSDTTLTSIGLAKGTALDMAALYGDMATSMGFSSATAADMSKTMVTLGADLASFKNISIDVANTALKSVFTGETESLKGLGVVMTQANLKAYAMAQGFTTAYDKMDQTQQVAVRYQYVLAQTANAQGDFARTSDNTANQLRILQESMKEAAALAGDQLLPIITPIVTRLGEMAQSFGDLDEGTRKAVVQTALFVATLGPMLKLTGGVAAAVSAAVAAHQALTAAQTAATAAQTGLNVAMSANPVGAVVTAIGALVAVLGSMVAVTALTADSHTRLTDSLEKSSKAHQDAVGDIGEYRANTLGMMQSLEELMAVEQKSAAEKAVVKGLVDQLNEAVPELSLAYNEQADSLNLTTSALERYIEAEAQRQLQQEVTDRLVELEKERVQIAQDLEEATIKKANAQAAYDQALRDGADASGAMSAENQAAIEGYGKAQAAVHDLTQAQETNQAETATLKAEYNNLSTAADKAESSVSIFGRSLEDAAASSDEMAKATRTLTSETETLSAAFAEQAEHGGLSLDTTLKLIEAGYGAALAVDEETSSVRLNAEAYATLALQKIEEQKADILDSQRETKARLLQAEGDAAMAAALGHTALALSYQETAKAIKGEMASTDAMLAQLGNLAAGMGTVITGNWSSKAATTPKSKKKTKTAEERNQDAFKAAVEELDYRHDMGEISEAEYYARLEALRDKYLTRDGDAWRDATVKLHKWREEQQKEAEEKAKKAKQEAYDDELADLKYFKDMALMSESSYYNSLAKLRDNHLEKESEEWRRITVEIHQWQTKQREEALKAEKEAYEAAQKQRTDLIKQYTDQRIAAIKAEQKAEEDRVNALIDGIDDEIAARKRLRQVDSDEDAIAKAQKTLAQVEREIEFARDENTRHELEKERIRAQESLNKAIQSKGDNDFYYTKEKEKDALRDQLDAAKDKYHGQIDNAPAWAAERVAAIEAAEARRQKAEEEASRKEQQRWEQEIAQMEAVQKAAAGALSAAGYAITNVSNAVTKITNNNSATINTGASQLTSGQTARLLDKAIEKMAKA